jgi:hypothetical protein
MAENLRGTIRVRVAQNVSLENLHGLLKRIVGIAGCTGCGLLGVDLHLTGDPVELQELTKVPGVQAVEYGP